MHTTPPYVPTMSGLLRTIKHISHVADALLTGTSHFKSKLKSLVEDASFLKDLNKTVGTASPGSRAWPTNRALDGAYGVRIDWGERIDRNKNSTDKNAKPDWWRQAILQINSNAENATLKNVVKKRGSHDKRATISIPLNEDGTRIADGITAKDISGALFKRGSI
ncbi:hypothetical protein H0H92_006097 [Tricholoma furcatifolium]|nr:hypothetical protein H0H92_006097 [Tricholoma furcatifolium]